MKLDRHHDGGCGTHNVPSAAVEVVVWAHPRQYRARLDGVRMRKRDDGGVTQSEDLVCHRTL